MNKTLIIAALTAVCLGCLGGSVAAQRPQPEVYGVFNADTMYTLLPPDGIPAITDPEYVTGAAADSQMQADEPVLAVVLGGEAVCWSTWQLDSHEIVDDTIAGTAIAATW